MTVSSASNRGPSRRRCDNVSVAFTHVLVLVLVLVRLTVHRKRGVRRNQGRRPRKDPPRCGIGGERMSVIDESEPESESESETDAQAAGRTRSPQKRTIEHISCQRQADGSYHVGDRGDPLGVGKTPWEAFHDYATNVHAAAEGESVPISEMPYHGSLKRPVNYIMLNVESLPDGAYHINEVGSKLSGWGPSKDEARIHLAELALELSSEGDR